MCGIAGFVGEGSRGVLEKMTRSLNHRGPDGEGYFFHPLAAGSYARATALGHRRLSVIDVVGGAQPMQNEDGSIIVIFNGEIYNYRELRASLEPKHTFTTHSDTEVLAHLYEERGAEFVRELEGMFAIALWDSPKESLVLARDRFGEKPLYFSPAPNAFLFGSELKALMAHPEFRRELDLEALRSYFMYEFVPAPRTIFKNVYKLQAGHYLVFCDGRYDVHRYWDIAERAAQLRPANVTLGVREAQEMLDEKLSHAVSKMLVADVPLGIFLSGGIDSSTVAYYAGQHASGRIKTFSVGFEDQSFDESAYACEVAKRLGTDHQVQKYSSADLVKVIPTIYENLDEPMADPSLVPTYMLAQYTRQQVTVALGGDGSDELLMGYQTFPAEKLSQLYLRLPRSLRESVIKPLIHKLPTSFSYMSLDFKLKRFVDAGDHPVAIKNQLWIGAFSPSELVRLFAQNISGSLFSDIEKHESVLRTLDPHHQMSYLYLTHFLQDGILTKVDRASMMHALEVRAPFLDSDLASWIFSLPEQYKLRGITTKYLLKRLMAPRLGRDIAYRAKQGFQPPVASWLKEDLAHLVDKYLSLERITAEGLFHAPYVRILVDEHQSGKVDHRKKLWALLVFEMWREHYLS